MVDPKDSAAIIEELSKETFEGCCVTKSGDYLVEVINAKKLQRYCGGVLVGVL
jgi:hypothetical protein